MSDAPHELGCRIHIDRARAEVVVIFRISEGSLKAELRKALGTPPLEFSPKRVCWRFLVGDGIDLRALRNYTPAPESATPDSLRSGFAEAFPSLGVISEVAEVARKFVRKNGENMAVRVDDDHSGVPWEILFADTDHYICVYRFTSSKSSEPRKQWNDCAAYFVCKHLQATISESESKARWAGGGGGATTWGISPYFNKELPDPYPVSRRLGPPNVFREMSANRSALFFHKALDDRRICISRSEERGDHELSSICQVSGSIAAVLTVANGVTDPPRGGTLAREIVRTGWGMGVSPFLPLSMDECANIGRAVTEVMYEIDNPEETGIAEWPSVQDVLQRIRRRSSQAIQGREGWIAVSTPDPKMKVAGGVAEILRRAERDLLAEDEAKLHERLLYLFGDEATGFKDGLAAGGFTVPEDKNSSAHDRIEWFVNRTRGDKEPVLRALDHWRANGHRDEPIFKELSEKIRGWLRWSA